MENEFFNVKVSVLLIFYLCMFNIVSESSFVNEYRFGYG